MTDDGQAPMPPLNPQNDGDQSQPSQAFGSANDQGLASFKPDPAVQAHLDRLPEEAADAELIEKEWVNKAKQIVEHTKGDPHQQQEAIGRMKADYMKKRYNKDINIADA